MIGTTIAIRYSAQRPQFGDKLIMDYLTHQRRLLPGLAATYALHLGLKQLKVCVVVKVEPQHATASACVRGGFVFICWSPAANVLIHYKHVQICFKGCWG